MYSTVLEIVKNIPSNIVDDKLFYNEITSKMNEG